MYFVNLPSEFAGNRLLFPDMKQQFLEFEIKGCVVFGVLFDVDRGEFV